MKKLIFLSIVIFLTNFSCSTSKTIKIEASNLSDQTAKASLLTFGSKNNPKELGDLPIELKFNDIKGKSVYISAPGHEGQNWIFPNSLGDDNTIKVRMKPQPEKGSKIFDQQARSSLLLLKSYKALIEKKFDLAMKLSDQSDSALKIGPGSLIIKAIANWQQGNSSEAKTLIEEAKALYPNTSELNELLKAVGS